MSSSGQKRPISSHPAFRWVVSVYFALLLGTGIFALLYFRNDLFQSLRDSGGLAANLPAGTVGMAIVAGAGAFIGFLLGLAIAMRVTALNEAADDTEWQEGLVTAETAWLEDEDVLIAEEEFIEQPRRPLNPREDIGEEGIDPLARLASRAKAVRDAEAAVMEPPEAETVEAPLPVWHEEETPEDGADTASDELLRQTEEYQYAPLEVSEDRIADDGNDQAAAAAFSEDAPPPEGAPRPARRDALGDMSLADLTERLGAALAAASARAAENPPEEAGEEDDPVVAFLRREADRAAPQRTEVASDEDPQKVLRSALDRLSQVGKPK